MKIYENLKISICLLLCFFMAAGSNLTADREQAFIPSGETLSSEQDGTYSEENFSIPDTGTPPENASASDTSDSSDTSHSTDTDVNSQQTSASEEKTPSSSSPSQQSGTSGGSSSAKPEAAPSKPSQVKPAEKAEMRAVWISFLEYRSILKNKSESQFRSSVKKYFDNCVSLGLNTVIVHARSHGDAFYKSGYFPASVDFTGKRQDSFPFDPLEITVKEAHARGLKIEAWVNPYRANKLTEQFSENDPVKKWLGTDKVFTDGEYYYFNPGEPEVRRLVLNGIIELVENYDIDGIHFDDYFYPTTDSSIDKNTYAKYGAGRTLKKFRTDSVNELVKTVYSQIKKRKNITFGISPQGNIDNCINFNYADVRLWGSTAGYVDYLAPQLYWDYGQGSLPYETALANWKKNVTSPSVKLITGHAAYRVAESGTGGWASGDILKRQVSDARGAANYGGFIMFRYDHLFSDALETERRNLKSILT